MGTGAGGFEFGEALKSGLRDIPQGVVRQEGLVPGNKDIGESEEPSKNIVLKNLRGAVLKKKASFFLIDVDGEMADLAPFQATDNGGSIKDGAAAGVDQKDAFFHEVEGLVVDEVAGGGKKGDVESDNVRLAKNLLRRDIAAEFGGIGMRGGVVGKDPAAEA